VEPLDLRPPTPAEVRMNTGAPYGAARCFGVCGAVPHALSYLAGLSSPLRFFFSQPVLFDKQCPGASAQLAHP
jgi:hypothetical protein